VNKVTEKSIEYYQVDFMLTKGGENYALFDEFKVIPDVYAKKYFEYFATMLSCTTKNAEYGEVQVLHLVLSILSNLVKDESAKKEKSEVEDKIASAAEYINTHFAESTPIKVLAAISNTSVSRLEKNFIRYTGLTPIAYRNNIRIERAKLLLLGRFSIAEVSERVGFSDVYYFAKTFKRITGVTPGKFVKNELDEIL
jgi:AraC-like DNA-binding protein